MSMIKDKVALITGGASGIGFMYARTLLKNGLKGVCIADVDPEVARNSTDQLNREFGANKAIFHQTDVTNREQFENAFKKTVENFKHIDILINNAGILNDAIWEREIAININGTIIGCLLAFEKYLTEHRSGPEGLIINIASIVGLDPFVSAPVYTATKHAVLGFSRSIGNPYIYNQTKIRVLIVCPGVTLTPLITDHKQKSLGPLQELLWKEEALGLPSQTSEQMASTLIDIINKGKSGSIWMTEGGNPACEIDSLPRNLRICK